MSNKKTTSSGIGLGGMVFCVFLLLKLTGNIDWSWWWVSSPLWLPLTIMLGVMGVLFLIAIIFDNK